MQAIAVMHGEGEEVGVASSPPVDAASDDLGGDLRKGDAVAAIAHDGEDARLAGQPADRRQAGVVVPNEPAQANRRLVSSCGNSRCASFAADARRSSARAARRGAPRR